MKNRTVATTPPTLSRRALVLGGALPLCAALLLSNGCHRPTDVPTLPEVGGSYTLVAVNGQDLPADIAHDGVMLQVRSGTFTINSDGTCNSLVVFVPPSGNEIRREVGATYSIDGPTLQMQWQGAGKTTGALAGKSFTMTNEGMVFSYRKQG